ncbi:MAG: hypothetical protein IJ298_03435 [Ruminococcus sp.]|nr:hypothetical protein [Ruminococcus sp.]
MKRHDYGLYAFSAGLILLVIQFLIITFNALNGTTPFTDDVFVYAEQITFIDVISSIWACLAGTVLLVVLFIRRFIKGHEAMLVLVGALLWVIQMFNMYESTYELKSFLLHYIIGIIGIFLIIVTGFYEAYYIKRIESPDNNE